MSTGGIQTRGGAVAETQRFTGADTGHGLSHNYEDVPEVRFARCVLRQGSD